VYFSVVLEMVKINLNSGDLSSAASFASKEYAQIAMRHREGADHIAESWSQKNMTWTGTHNFAHPVRQDHAKHHALAAKHSRILIMSFILILSMTSFTL
jgi:hypothetical protein